ncbi:MAG: ATP synthase subunit I [Clostridiales bacterium]|nr:ATP synthase subunit I [Clostridiales bacterium]
MGEAKETLIGLEIGIGIITFLAAVLFGLLHLGFPYLAGVLVGGVVAAGLAYHMYTTLDEALDLGEDSVNYVRKKSILRILIMGLAVLAAIRFPQYLNLLGVGMGILSLKMSALLQPVIQTYIVSKIYRKGE